MQFIYLNILTIAFSVVYFVAFYITKAFSLLSVVYCIAHFDYCI